MFSFLIKADFGEILDSDFTLKFMMTSFIEVNV